MKSNILAIDTTTKCASVSIYTNDTFYTRCIDNEITHSEKLLPLIDELLKQAKITISDVSVILTTNGPGSFTGIRIGLATIKGIATVYNPKIYAINNLDLLALECNPIDGQYILPVLDAKNSRAYYELLDGNYNVILPPQNETIQDMLQTIEPLTQGKKTHIVGNINQICTIPISKPNMELLINLYLQNKLNPYETTINSLNATYARASEAQRKKYGE